MSTLKIGDKLWHPCSIDIIEHKVVGIRQYEGFTQYETKAVHNVGASGKVELIIDERNGKFRFVELLNGNEYASGLGDFVEGFYYPNKTTARIEFYEIHRVSAWSNMEEKKRLYEEAKKRFDQIVLLVKNLKEELNSDSLSK